MLVGAVNSWRFRKLFIPAFFFIVTVVSALWSFRLPDKIVPIMRFIGLVLIVLSTALAFYVHSLFPKRHDLPEDFDELLTDGPYRYVRHPFYSALILIGFGIALFFESVPGLIAVILMLPLWEKLAELEERELLGYWREEYRRFMEKRGRFVPKLRNPLRKIR